MHFRLSARVNDLNYLQKQKAPPFRQKRRGKKGGER